jgi:hypothetical protein
MRTRRRRSSSWPLRRKSIFAEALLGEGLPGTGRVPHRDNSALAPGNLNFGLSGTIRPISLAEFAG